MKLMNYFKRIWDETRGDEFDDWGKSIWYFELDSEGFPKRQIEKYENGKVLKYDEENESDNYGGLGDQILDMEEFKNYEISEEEFQREWVK